MNPIPWRKMAEKTLEDMGHEVPTLHEVMNQTVDSGKNGLWNIIESVRSAIPKAISSAQAAVAQLSFSGSTGNFLSTEENICLTGKFYRIADTYPEKIGCPLYSAVYLNSLNGFTKCQNAIFSSTIATSTEETAVETFLNNGFYYE